MTKAFLTPDELAERWATSRSTIYRKVKEGEAMPSYMHLNDGPRARIRFAIADVEAYENARSSAPVYAAPEQPLPAGPTVVEPSTSRRVVKR